MKKFQPLPMDKYQVQITDVNLVQQANQFKGGEMEDRLNFEFTVLDDKTMEEVNDEGEKEIVPIRGRRLWKRIAPSNSSAGKKSKASWFYKLLCAVEKKELTEEELVELAPVSLVGQQLLVMVEIAGEYNNILGFQPAEKELKEVPNADDRAAMEQEVVDPEEVKVETEDKEEKVEKPALPF